MNAAARAEQLADIAIGGEAERLAAALPDLLSRHPVPVLMLRVRDLSTACRGLLLDHANGPRVYSANEEHRRRVGRLLDLRLVFVARDRRTTALTALGQAVVCTLLARMADSLIRQQDRAP